MTEEEDVKRKAVESFLSGRKNPGSEETWVQPRTSPTKDELRKMEGLAAPVSTKDLKIRGRKKGTKTPRQTIRIDEALWISFQKACRRKESKSASEVVREFIQRYTAK